jgi:branched-chain amino acid transport system ATP-binding protein
MLKLNSHFDATREADRARPVGRPDDASHLQIRDLTVRFGGITALDNVSFTVQHGTICGLIGPNGAGKTTCFNCISSVYLASVGIITLDDQPLTGLKRHAVALAGVGRTFQNLALFPSMSVRENVMVGAHGRGRGGFLASMFKSSAVRKSEVEIGLRADELIERLGLDSVAHMLIGSLPFATQKRVELARALAGRPSLLILDEPAAGLNHEEVDELANQILRIRDQEGVSILLVEHHMNLVMKISDKVVVLNFGRKIADGLPSDVRADAAVTAAYLGVDE